MKRIFLFLGTLAISGLYAQQTQVGINTTAPKATLDIQANPNAVAGTNEGILIPRISKEKVAQMSTPETSTLVYVNDISFTTTEPKVANITKVGFYHYNGTVWIAGLGDDTSIYTQNGTLTENRTVDMNGKNLLFTGNGNVGIGTNAPLAKLDVLGNAKASQFHSYSLVSNTNLHPAVINLGATGGTFENPEYVKKGNTLGGFVTRDMRSNKEAAAVNSIFYGGSEIYAHATEDFSATNKGSNLMFKTTSNGQKQSVPRILIDEDGKTKIGGITEVSPGIFSSPQATLDIAGNVKIADGTQGEGKVLTSDANGKASWKTILNPSFDGIPDAVWTVGGTNTPSKADLDTNPVVYSTNHPNAGGNSFTVNKTGWYAVWSRWFWRQRLPVSGVIDQGNAFAWIQINTDPGPYMDGPGMVYEYRTIVNRVLNSVSPPSGFLIYLKANQPYYIHQVTVNTEFPTTGERNFKLYFVQ